MTQPLQTNAPLRAARAATARILQALAFAVACAAAIEANAQVCCPGGCVQNNNSCVTTGANQQTCPTVPCTGGPSSGTGSGSGSPGGGALQPTPAPPPPTCFAMQPTQATINEVANRCVASLVANAQLIGCLFEDDAGKAEDKRTGLTCAQRQAALARQCNTRCAQFAERSTRISCTTDGFDDGQWVVAFGDIGGKVVGSARVADCGPRLKTAVVIIKSEKAKQKSVPSVQP